MHTEVGTGISLHISRNVRFSMSKTENLWSFSTNEFLSLDINVIYDGGIITSGIDPLLACAAVIRNTLISFPLEISCLDTHKFRND